MTTASRAWALLAIVVLAFGIGMPAKADLVKELIPTGKLRVAIAVAPACPLEALRTHLTPVLTGVHVSSVSSWGYPSPLHDMNRVVSVHLISPVDADRLFVKVADGTVEWSATNASSVAGR